MISFLRTIFTAITVVIVTTVLGLTVIIAALFGIEDKPGGIYEFNRAGRILWSYHPRSGYRMLDHPSLAERLPNGLIAVNDDYRHRVVLINPKTKRIVWQYGHTDRRGSRPGFLRVPDGFDLLGPGGTMPTHPYTG